MSTLPSVVDALQGIAAAMREADARWYLLPVISPDDLIVTRILAGRPKDIEDVRAVIRARRDEIDPTRIRSLLRLLEEALGQSDLLRTLEAELRP